MADDTTKDAIGQAATWLGGGGVLAGLGVLLRGLLSGSLGQEKDLRDGQAERLAVLEAQNEKREARIETISLSRDQWRQLAFQARIEAEKLGYDRTKWPTDPPP